MNKLILFIFLLLLVGPLQSQEFQPELDTVFVKRHVEGNKFRFDTLFIRSGISSPQILTGTTFLPFADGEWSLLNHGIKPLSLILGNGCEGIVNPDDKPYFFEIKFAERDTMTKQLTIQLKIIDNCCSSFLGSASISEDDQLELDFIGYGGSCSCECCFVLEYTFDTSMESRYGYLQFVNLRGSESIKAPITLH